MTEMASLVLFAASPAATMAFYRAVGLELEVVAQMRRQTRMNPLVRPALRAGHGHPVFRIEPQ
jgi:hypothetical protein